MKTPMFWQRWRAQGAAVGRYLPTHIIIFLMEAALALAIMAYTAPALFTHYAGIVPGYEWLGRFGILIPEMIAVALIVIATVSGYEGTGKRAFLGHLALVCILALHGGLIYAMGWAERHERGRVEQAQAQRRELAAAQRQDAIERARATAEIQSSSLQAQAADIRKAAQARAAKMRAAGNPSGASWTLSEAEQRITRLYSSHAGVSVNGQSDAVTGTATTDAADVPRSWSDRQIAGVVSYVSLYINSPLAALLPLFAAIFALVWTVKRWQQDSAHERAALGMIRTPAARNAYKLRGTGALPGWTPDDVMPVPQARRPGIGFASVPSADAKKAPR